MKSWLVLGGRIAVATVGCAGFPRAETGQIDGGSARWLAGRRRRRARHDW